MDERFLSFLPLQFEAVGFLIFSTTNIFILSLDGWMIWIAPSFPICFEVFKSDFIIAESLVSGSGRVVTLPSLSLD